MVTVYTLVTSPSATSNGCYCNLFKNNYSTIDHINCVSINSICCVHRDQLLKYAMSFLPWWRALLSLIQILSHAAKVKNGNTYGHLHPSRLSHHGWPTMQQDCVRLETTLWSMLDAREALMVIWKMFTVHSWSDHSKVCCNVCKCGCTCVPRQCET